MDDSGMFSLQVISSALKTAWNLNLIAFTSSHELAIVARSDPR